MAIAEAVTGVITIITAIITAPIHHPVQIQIPTALIRLHAVIPLLLPVHHLHPAAAVVAAAAA
jgi:hypothetical protein